MTSGSIGKFMPENIHILSKAMPKWRFGIGARLGAAFITIVGLAVGACTVGWLSYYQLSGELSHIAEEQIPRLVFASRLSKTGADIGSLTSPLAGAKTRSEYNEIRRVYAAHLDELENLLENGDVNQRVNTILPVAQTIQHNLLQIDMTAGKRFTLIEAMHADIDELRWVQADLIDEAAPLVDDTRFNIETEMRNSHDAAALDEQRKSEALLSLVAQASLSTGLIARLANGYTADDLQETNAFLGDSADELNTHLTTLKSWPDSITVRQLAKRILDKSNPENGTPNRKRSQMRETARLEELVVMNNHLVNQLGRNIAAEVTAIEARAAEAAERAANAINTGRKLLAAIALLSVLLAVAIGVFYVHRNLLLRIRQLALAANAISAGRADTDISAKGTDELADLAAALILFRQTRDELVQSAKLAALGQMAAGIGHELNQPLAAIRAHIHSGSKFIERGNSDRALANFEKIRLLTTRMANQISHIRRFARRPDTKQQSVNLYDTIHGALSLLEHRFDEENVTLKLDLPTLEQPLFILAEQVRLEQVIVNLIANALDAVKEHSIRVVTISVTPNEQGADLSITDTGSGIDTENLNAIFDPFFTTKPVGSGLGLGLSISYNIVKDFGASLSVADTGPQGTRFIVALKGS